MEIKADQLGDGLFITERVAPAVELSVQSSKRDETMDLFFL